MWKNIQGGGVYAGTPAKRIGEFSDVMEKRMNDSTIKRIKTERFDEIWDVFYEKYIKNKV